MGIYRIIMTFILALFLISCTSKEERNSRRNKNLIPPYEFNNPTMVIQLPKELKEISGISFVNNNTLACISDEYGIIYHFDIQKKEITQRIKFSEDGDFEDIVYINGIYYILNSKGNLLQLKNGKTTEYSTPLNKYNNTEGLCYDSKNNELLIACKENSREVFAFDLNLMKLKEPSILRIEAEDFYPTALAINQNDDLYLLAGNGQFGIYRFKDSVGNTINLKDKLFPQPEGMALSESGDLWISNEGKDGPATLLLFKRNE